MVQRAQRMLGWGILASELSHVFCCILPVLFSLATFLVTFGFLSAMPVFVTQAHDVMHRWEVPMIMGAGVMVMIGWALHTYSVYFDCHTTGCHHGSCRPAKRKTSRLLVIATLLFAVNLAVYMALHYGGDGLLHIEGIAEDLRSGGHGH